MQGSSRDSRPRSSFQLSHPGPPPGWLGAFSKIFRPLLCLASLASATALAQSPSPTSPPTPRLNLIDAVRLTLTRDPNIRINEERVQFARGQLERESGAFDYTFDTATSKGISRVPRTELERIQTAGRTNVSDNVTDLINQRVGISKQLRSGPSLSLGADINRFDDTFDRAAINRANISFVINVPLLKGAGASSQAAAERAAQIGVDAALLEQAHDTSQRILNTTVAYWTCLGVEKDLTILKGSAEQSQALFDKVKQLVAGGEIPAAELKQAAADVAEKRASVDAGQQRLLQARHAFALAIGADGSEHESTALPLEVWPQVDTNRPPALASADPQIVQSSLARRADYQSSLKAGRAAQILETAARRDLRPQLDLSLETGYSGLSEGSQFKRFYGAADPSAVNGPNAMASLRFVYPFGNHAAKGLLAQRSSLRKQAELQQQDSARTIRSAITVAFSELASTRDELIKARIASLLYHEAVTNEREKLRIGSSTILDVINTADRLSSAEIRSNEALVRYAIALARVRFETGLLVATADLPQVNLDLQEFTTPPDEHKLRSAPTAAPKNRPPQRGP